MLWDVGILNCTVIALPVEVQTRCESSWFSISLPTLTIVRFFIFDKWYLIMVLIYLILIIIYHD